MALARLTGEASVERVHLPPPPLGIARGLVEGVGWLPASVAGGALDIDSLPADVRRRAARKKTPASRLASR